MFRKMCIVMILLFSTLLFGAGGFDKDIVVKNQSRNDKVKTVFREMMDAYEEEDIERFFSYVSEDRFEQDYMTFYEAIDKDMRVYDILNIDTWVNKITDDGVKRFLYVQWDKRYLTTTNDTEINQKGYSRFLFDEINGKYKLIQLAGNNFWSESLPEWTEEVGDIAGQEPKVIVGENSLPDLVVQNLICPLGQGGSMTVEFDLVNLGADTTSGTVEYDYSGKFFASQPFYNGNILAGDSVHISITGADCYGNEVATVDPNNLIVESNENNNELTN